MSDDEARVRLSLRDWEFEISGPEKFVSSQINDWKSIILELGAIKLGASTHTSATNVPTLPVAEGDHTSTSGTALPMEDTLQSLGYPTVFDVRWTEIKVLKAVPGSSNAQKTVNCALVYLWAKDKVGVDTIWAEEIRKLCKDQGCLDTSNFAAYMKKNKYILLEKNMYRLALPGKEEAKKVIEMMK